MTGQPNDVRIVPFAPRHGAAWRALNEAWITRYFVLEPKDREVLNDPKGQVLDKGGTILIAEKAGEPIGCIAIVPMEDGGFEMVKMAVGEHAQGGGIGRKLIDACIAAGKAAGATRLYLETNSSLAPALHLYRSAGFVDLPAQPTPYARCDVWMEMKLR